MMSNFCKFQNFSNFYQFFVNSFKYFLINFNLFKKFLKYFKFIPRVYTLKYFYNLLVPLWLMLCLSYKYVLVTALCIILRYVNILNNCKNFL